MLKFDRKVAGEVFREDYKTVTGKPLTAKTMVELRAKIYEAEGWTREAGESAAKRIKDRYDIQMDQRRNRWIATPKADSPTQIKSATGNLSTED